MCITLVLAAEGEREGMYLDIQNMPFLPICRHRTLFII